MRYKSPPKFFHLLSFEKKTTHLYQYSFVTKLSNSQTLPTASMKSFAVAITALASIATARFSGTLDILMVYQNNCLYASIDPRDTQLMVGCDH